MAACFQNHSRSIVGNLFSIDEDGLRHMRHEGIAIETFHFQLALRGEKSERILEIYTIVVAYHIVADVVVHTVHVGAPDICVET